MTDGNVFVDFQRQIPLLNLHHNGKVWRMFSSLVCTSTVTQGHLNYFREHSDTCLLNTAGCLCLLAWVKKQIKLNTTRFKTKTCTVQVNIPQVKTTRNKTGIWNNSWVEISSREFFSKRTAWIIQSRLWASMPSTHSHFHTQTQTRTWFLICWVHQWVYCELKPSKRQK